MVLLSNIQYFLFWGHITWCSGTLQDTGNRTWVGHVKVNALPAVVSKHPHCFVGCLQGPSPALIPQSETLIRTHMQSLCEAFSGSSKATHPKFLQSLALPSWSLPARSEGHRKVNGVAPEATTQYP